MKKLLLTGILIAAINSTSFAQSLISFEASEGYNLGDINGQQGWNYYGNSIEPNSGMVNSSSATHGSRSVNFVSNDHWDDAGVIKTVNTYPKTSFSFDYKIQGIGGSYFGIYTYDANNDEIAFFDIHWNTGIVRIFDANSTNLVSTNLALTPNTWYNFKMVIDIPNKTVEYFVNNVSYGTKAINASISSFNTIDFYYDDDGTGFSFDNIRIENAANLGVKDIANIDNFSVSPNPTIDFVNIKTEAKINSVEVVDLSGKTVFTDVSGSDRVNMSELPAGGYLLQVNTTQGIFKKKIIKK